MNTEIILLPNLDRLNGGTQKHWIWQFGRNHLKSCDYLQKINHSIQDLNHEIGSIAKPSMKEVVYVIALVDWICEAVDALPKLLVDGVITGFHYEKQTEFETAKKYFKAIRSFVLAHPLSTDRHPAFGFDGDKICVDIRGKTSVVTQALSAPGDWYHLSINGLVPNAKDVPADFVLYIYSESRDNMQFFKYIGADFQDLYHVAEVYIDRLYALDKYLKRLKKKDWI